MSKAKNATFLFYRDFMEYHEERFEDHSVMVYKNEKLVAILPANTSESTIFSHQGLTYGGLVVLDSLKIKDFIACFKATMNYYKKIGFSTFKIKQLPSIYCSIPQDEMQYLMFILEAKLVRRDALSVLCLQQKLKMSKDRIAGNKRAIKQGLVVKEETTLDSFWNTILIPNLEEKHKTKPVHSLEEISMLKNEFPDKIRQFNVYHSDKLVAGTTIFETKNVAHSQYISGNEDKNTIGSLDFLHMYLIENVFQDKMYFDFGISNENQGKNINEGLQYWKEGFGARTITQDFYEIDLNNVIKLDTILI